MVSPAKSSLTLTVTLTPNTNSLNLEILHIPGAVQKMVRDFPILRFLVASLRPKGRRAFTKKNTKQLLQRSRSPQVAKHWTVYDGRQQNEDSRPSNI